MSFPRNKLHSNTRILERPEPWSRMEIVLWASHTSYVSGQESYVWPVATIASIPHYRHRYKSMLQKNVIIVLTFDRSHTWNLN